MKQINIFIILIFIAIASWFIYDYVVDNNEDYSRPAQIDELRRMVKLNSMQIHDEIVYKDTVDNFVIVLNTSVNIIIGFDVKNLQWYTEGDTMFVVMPNPTIEKYQVGKERCLDIYDLREGNMVNVANTLIRPTINSAQSAELHNRLSKYIDKTIEREHYAEKAKKNAMTNLAKLFYAFKKNIVIIDKSSEDIILEND